MTLQEVCAALDEMEKRFPRKTTPKEVRMNVRTLREIKRLIPSRLFILEGNFSKIEGLPLRIYAYMEDGLVQVINLDDEVIHEFRITLEV